MIGKVALKSYSAKWWKQVNRKCPTCKKRLAAQLVDYGKGGQVLAFECGHEQETKGNKR